MTSTEVRAGTEPGYRPAGRAAAVAGVAVAALAFVRLALGGAVARTVWAEDGAVFLQDAVYRPEAFLAPFAGYGHLLDRSLAAVTVLFPIGSWPMLVVGTSLAGYALLGGYIYRVAERLELDSWKRWLGAVVLVAVPAAGHEILGNWANSQWFVVYAGVWALLDPRRGWVAAVIVGAAVASSPAVLLLVPLAVVVRPSRPMVVAGLLGLGYQLAAIADPFGAASTALRHPSGDMWSVLPALGNALTDSQFDPAPTISGLLALAVLVAAGIAVVQTRDRVGIALVVGALSVGIGPALVSGDATSRYASLAVAVLIAAVLVSRVRWSRWLALAFVLVAVVNLPVSAFRSSGPAWSDELPVACGGSGDGIVDIAPTGFNAHVC